MNPADAYAAIRRYGYDFESGMLEVELINGERLQMPAPDLKLAKSFTARSVEVDLHSCELQVVLPEGQLAVLELGSERSDRKTAGGRLVVYLDQLHWITLAQHLRAPEKVRVDEREAADRLVGYARSRRIILAFASSHLTEAPIGGKHRRDLATAVLTLSRGWQMRTPHEVRRREFCAALAGRDPRALDVFTLEPGAVFSTATDVPEASADLPVAFRDVHRRLTSVSAIYESMLEEEGVDKAQGAKAARRWATVYSAFAERVQSSRPGPAATRRAALAALTSDVQLELAGAAASEGIAPVDFAGWMSGSWEEAISRMPYTSRLFELTYERFRNPDDRWKPNDLIDMQFLCLAAGYADILVGERKMSELIGRANSRLPKAAFVCRTLSAAAQQLESLLPDDSDRS